MAREPTQSDPLGKALGQLIRNVIYGTKKMKRQSNLIGLGCAVVIAAAVFLGREKILHTETLFGKALPAVLMFPLIRLLLLGALLLLPLWYLASVGAIEHEKAKKCDKRFADVGFKGKDGKYPFLIQKSSPPEQPQVVIYRFQAMIPLSDWESRKKDLETSFDCDIRSLRNGSSKQIVEMVTTAGWFKLPDMVHWDIADVDESDSVFAVGQGVTGTATFNVNKYPHVLIAGQTGSGKSVVARSLLTQALCRGSKVYMFDFKGGIEFMSYEEYGEVISEHERALAVLNSVQQEMQRRLNLLRENGVKNLPEYRKQTHSNLPRIFLVFDEYAEALDKTNAQTKEEKAMRTSISGAIASIARLGRAPGVHLILGMQRPDAKVFDGQIKSNTPVRICGRFEGHTDSYIVLDNGAAQNLPGILGRFIFQIDGHPEEVQTYYISDDDILSIPQTTKLNPVEDYPEGDTDEYEPELRQLQKSRPQVPKPLEDEELSEEDHEENPPEEEPEYEETEEDLPTEDNQSDQDEPGDSDDLDEISIDI